MSINLFVTHGRGLNVFAQEEIREKIENVMNVQSLGEGKTSFTVPLEKDCVSDKGENSSKEELINKVSAVFDLKLVERAFILLHYEQFSQNDNDSETIRRPETPLKQDDNDEKKNTLQEYADKLLNLIEPDKLMTAASQVQALRTFQHQHAVHISCQDADSCPGSMKRRADYEKLRQKRILKTDLSFCKRARREAKPETDKTEFQETNNKIYDTSHNIEHLGGNSEKIPNPIITDTGAGSPATVSVFDHSLGSLSIPESYYTDDSRTCNLSKDIKKNTNNKELHNETVINKNSKDKLEVVESVIPSTKYTSEEISSSKSEMSFREDVNKKCFEECDLNSNSEASVTFRVSSRISGKNKKILTQQWIAQTFVKLVIEIMKDWTTEWRKPLLDFYINITNTHFILGVSLSKESLSLRPYIPHIKLRSTICYLMARLAKIPEGGLVLDPMCGGGTILLEAAKSFKVGMLIGGDVNMEQLAVSKCNLQNAGVPCSLLCMDATAMPLPSRSVSAVICDIPFGQKHHIQMGNEIYFLQGVLCEIQRVLMYNGHLVLLLSVKQHALLQKILFLQTSHNSSELDDKVKEQLHWKFEASYLVSLGETSAYVAVLVKIVTCDEI